MSEDDPKDPSVASGSYDGFLKTAITSYWNKGGNRVNFIALLLASREAWEVAFDQVASRETGRKMLTGAAGVTAVLLLLRALLGGPIGLVLSGLSIASLGTLYVRNHRLIWAQQERYRGLISAYRVKHQDVRGKYLEGVVSEEERDLMIDGLLRRFLDELDDKPDLPEPPGGDEEEANDEVNG